jgi:uncharacterized protein YjbJ (UPF0337 family)
MYVRQGTPRGTSNFSELAQAPEVETTYSLLKGCDMNTDKLKGSIKETAGKAQEELGEATGSTRQQVKGIQKQVEGKTDKAIGNVRDALDDDKVE